MNGTKKGKKKVSHSQSENLIVIRDPNFNFDWPKDVDEHLKHETELIIKSNESLEENKKNEIGQLLLKHKHGNDSKTTAKQMNHGNLFLTCHKD